MLRLIFSLIALTFVASVALANDTALVAVGGTVVPMHGKHASVQMFNETVQLDLYKDHYETSVDFLFTNTGKATKVMMGFPERGVGIDGGKTDGNIQDFVTTVDDQPLTAKRIAAASSPGGYKAYWTKTVDFGPNQKRHIHVHFRSPYGGGLGGTLAAYDFTGGNWRSQVGESRLIVTRHPGAPVLPIAKLDNKVLPEGKTPASRTFVWRNWQAEGEFVLSEKNF